MLVLDPEPALKLIAVTGSNKIDEAKIGGITPAVFIFRGRWLLSPWKIFIPTCLLGY